MASPLPVAVAVGILSSSPASHPAAMVFEAAAGVTSYVVYNYSDAAINVTFSDGTVVEAAANQFTIEQM